jgi:hypothetical protein
MDCCISYVCGRRNDFQEADDQGEDLFIVIPAKAGTQDYARFRGHPYLDPVFQRGDRRKEFSP